MKTALLCASLTLFGCGASALETARLTVQYTAEAGNAADETLSPRYVSAARDALAETLEAGEDLEAYHERMQTWDGAAHSLQALFSALHVAQRALDAWEAGDDSHWLGAAGCVVSALGELADGLTAVGVPIPDALTKALETLTGFTSAACEGARR